MLNGEGVNPHKRPRSDSGPEDNNGNKTNQVQDMDRSQTPPKPKKIAPREEEMDDNAVFNDDQADILAEIEAKAAKKHANNSKTPNLPTYGDQEYTPIPPNGFPTIHSEDPLWTLNNVASPQVLDWFRLDGAKVVVLIEKEVSHEVERAASLADVLAKDINENFKITGTKAVYGYADFTANSKWDEPPYTFCVFNLPNRVAQSLISNRMWRSKCLCYTCFPLG